jgi:hypothetical protein
MVITEESMRFLEEHIPELVGAAITQAYWQALATGNSVLQYNENAIYEVFPDGTRKWIKDLPPQTPVTLGQQVIIK